MPRSPYKRRCARPGCRAWAMRGGEYCSAHIGPDGLRPEPPVGAGLKPFGAEPLRAKPAPTLARGFYSSYYSEREIALIAAFLNDMCLDDELWMTRIVNSRLLARLSEGEVDDHLLLKIATTLLRGADRVAKLLQARRVLSPETAQGFSGAFTKMLEELNEISGWRQKL